MSNDIYKEKKYNYVYQITNNINGMKYIGSRGTNNEPMEDLKKYRSSSRNNTLKTELKNHPESFIYEILSLHDTRSESYIEESRLHKLYDVMNNNEFYNMTNHGSNKFTTCGMVAVRDTFNNTMLVSINDERYLNGELVSVNLGRKASDETRLKMSERNKGDNNHFYGKKHTNETKAKLAEYSGDKSSMYGKSHTDEVKKYLSYINKGRNVSDETKEKLKIVNSGIRNHGSICVSVDGIVYESIKFFINIYGCCRNTVERRCLSSDDVWSGWLYINKDEVCDNDLYKSRAINNMSEYELSMNQHYNETKRRLNSIMLPIKNYTHTDDSKKKISEGNKGKIITDETRKKISIACSGKNNKRSKPVSVCGIIYDCGNEVIKLYKISKYHLKTRCLSDDPKWEEWFYVGKE